MSLKISVDFTNVKESSGFNPKRMEAGDYLAEIVSVTKDKSKAGSEMLIFAFQLQEHKSAVYPYYIVLDDKSLWKLRNILVALGKKAPKGKASIDVERLVGSTLGVALEDDEYEGKEKSVIDSIFAASEIAGDPSAPAADEDEDSADVETGEDEDLDELDL